VILAFCFETKKIYFLRDENHRGETIFFLAKFCQKILFLVKFYQKFFIFSKILPKIFYFLKIRGYDKVLKLFDFLNL